MKIKGKGARFHSEKKPSKKKVRVCPYVPSEEYRKLRKLAFALEKTPAEAGLEIWKIALNNPDFIEGIQRHYNVPSEDRVTPIVENGKVYY